MWIISDPSTAAFMKSFYINLNLGMTKVRALQESKIWMKERSYHTDEHGKPIKGVGHRLGQHYNGLRIKRIRASS